jgi:hypothetical protein
MVNHAPDQVNLVRGRQGDHGDRFRAQDSSFDQTYTVARILIGCRPRQP